MDTRATKGRGLKPDSLQGQAPFWIDLDDLPQGPGPYTISFGFSLEALCASIEKAGVINPILVTRNETGRFDIVSGYRRILALRALRETKVLCKDVTAVFPSFFERFLTNFYDNLSLRTFNDIEKALVLHKLQRYLSGKEIVAEFMPLLSLPSHEDTLKFYLELITLEEELQLAIAKKEISVKAAKALMEFDLSSQKILFQWVNALRFNLNQQVKLFEYAQDIGRREGRTITQVLSEESFLLILNDARLNTPQKAKKVLETLRVRRYPRLAHAQQVIGRTLAAIPLPRGAAIHYDPSLEDPNYHLEVDFADGKELRNTLEGLLARDELESIPAMWEGA